MCQNSPSPLAKGGNIARIAKEQLERETGKKIVSNKNAKEIRKLNSGEKQ